MFWILLRAVPLSLSTYFCVIYGTSVYEKHSADLRNSLATTYGRIMPLSMRAQSQAHRQRKCSAEVESQRRRRVLDLFRKGYNVRKAGILSGVSNNTGFSIEKCATSDDKSDLRHVLNPKHFWRGLSAIRSPVEEKLIVKNGSHRILPGVFS